MEMNVFIKCLVLFGLACLHDKPEVSAHPSKAQTDMLNYIKQERHWQNMGFNRYFDYNDKIWKPIQKLWIPDKSFLVRERLNTISTMMGCAYGPQLNWFILLTFEVIDECDKMRKNNDQHAGDCRAELDATVEKGKYVILKLIVTLWHIDPLSHVNMDRNRFYQTLEPLYSFLTGKVNIEYSGIIPGGLVINQTLNAVAEALKEMLLFSCLPDYRLFNLTEIKSEYNKDIHPNGIYSLYIVELNNFISYIDVHLTQLGFHYDPITDRLTFNPDSSA